MEKVAITSLCERIVRPAWPSRSLVLIRLAVGLIFFSQGLLKYLNPNIGLNRFRRIGFAHPAFTAHAIGGIEVVCGLLIVVGLATRLASVPLLGVIATAMGTTKIPELVRPRQGFWFMVSDARADFAMLLCLIFLLHAGSGVWSLDARWWARGKR